MKAKELLDAGQLTSAIEQLNQDVRLYPTDFHLRAFLFELLCFAGDYQRAARQLDAIGHQSTTAEVGVQVYRNILTAEGSRRRLFSEGLQPNFLLDPPSYALLHLEAVHQLREKQPEEALALLEASESSRPRLRGRLEGEPFQDFRDSDDLLGPFLEVFLHDNYVWLPYEQVDRLTIAAPKQLRDLLWIPATIECRYGPVGEVFLPVLYPGSSEDPDDQIRLGRMTNWQAVAEGPVLGVGQRVFLVDGAERAMLEIRGLEFEGAASTGQV